MTVKIYAEVLRKKSNSQIRNSFSSLTLFPYILLSESINVFFLNEKKEKNFAINKYIFFLDIITVKDVRERQFADNIFDKVNGKNQTKSKVKVYVMRIEKIKTTQQQ